ncbi:MAG: PQQ-dependent sugar dehydrogenase [Planctomycetota bacterium]
MNSHESSEKNGSLRTSLLWVRFVCVFLLVLILMPAPGYSESGSTPLTTRRIASGVSRPVLVTAPDGDFERLFIVQQAGIIRIYDMTSGNLLTTPFLNINSIVGGGTSGADERGLLGMAFHPDYLNNGFFYLYYTNNSSNTVVARFSVSSSNPDVANPSPDQILFTQNQPFTNHNGGMIAFGPNDGYLYIGLGDGGSANDPQGNSQNQNTRLGKMLRLDVDGGSPYAIPPDNPFAGPGAPLDEIWASGLRNPWRFSFDRLTGDMYIADVGQFNWEEISIQPASSAGGENYGWRCMEGNSCTGLSGCACNAASLTDPVQVYSHGSGCSITGGNVYRGCAMPDMHGIYFYSDWCSSTIWSFEWNGSSVQNFTNRTSELDPPGSQSIAGVTGFGEDAYGEIYICDWNGGEIFKIVPANIDALDANGNFIVDSCECAIGNTTDCNNNGEPDACDIASGVEVDCNEDSIPDSCQTPVNDCNSNGIEDSCDIAAGASDCDGDGIPDTCQLDTQDCDGNGVHDVCDINNGTLVDCDFDNLPDSCEVVNGTGEDCNSNTLLDNCEIDLGIADDCNNNGSIDSCEVDAGTTADCNNNGNPDSCDIASGAEQDDNTNGIPDSCEAANFKRGDPNEDGVVNIADAVRILGFLFNNEAEPSCLDSTDVNDDGSLDISDGVALLTYLFGTASLPLPGENCGPDPTADGLDCGSYSNCP